MNQTSLWLLLAAVLVGFAAAWLVSEVRRAWSPESLRDADHTSAWRSDAEDLRDLMPTLVHEVTQLRREIAAMRAAEIEFALRNRQRELQLTQALRTPPPVDAAPPQITANGKRRRGARRVPTRLVTMALLRRAARGGV
jgi:hypothetical protein